MRWLRRHLNLLSTRRRGASLARAIPFSTVPKWSETGAFEEENMQYYAEKRYCPINIGDVFNHRYQVLTKLGYGGGSTVWLCRDLIKHRYMALKMFAHADRTMPEIAKLEHIANTNTNHPGKSRVRTIADSFQFTSERGVHDCIINEPLLTSVKEFLNWFEPKAMTTPFLRGLLQHLFAALDFLHSVANVVHTDIRTDNILISSGDPAIFQEWDAAEQSDPSPRKIMEDGTLIYKSRSLQQTVQNLKRFGEPVLSDFDVARIGDSHRGICQPRIYRAPEVVLGMNWNSKVDIWNVACLIWTLHEDHALFTGPASGKDFNDTHHLAQMHALLGPPPAQFLARSEACAFFWDQDGNWRGTRGFDIPDKSLESEEIQATGDEKIAFLNFIRKMLRWDPEERATAKMLLDDDWMQKRF